MGVLLDYDEARGLLKIDKHNLDEELRHQPSLYLGIGEALAAAEATRDRVAQSRDKLEAELVQELVESSARTAIDKLRGKAQQDPEVRRLASSLIAWDEEVRKWRHLLEACRQRMYSLRELTQLHVANYYQRDSVNYQGLSEEAYSQTRERLAQERMRRRGVS